jgi:hypothetical protein
VEILQTVKGREQNTRTVRFGKKARFIVLYHVANAPSAIPSGTLSITKNGKSLHTYKLYPFTLNGHAGLRKGITFSNKKDAGGLFAHFRLTLGAASAKRDRKFSLK